MPACLLDLRLTLSSLGEPPQKGICVQIVLFLMNVRHGDIDKKSKTKFVIEKVATGR